MLHSYYADKLSAERLKRCYDIAPPRVQQYLRAEIEYIRGQVLPGNRVLDIGCGFGRTLRPLAEKAGLVFGIDISIASLRFGKPFLQGLSNCHLLGMDAGRLAFCDGAFDTVLCIQNGISAFRMSPLLLISEGLRVTREDGLFLLSSYSEKFWEARLEWFQLQAGEGLIGEIDPEKTGNGVIVCKDGFRATTFAPHQLLSLASKFDADAKIAEINGSSLFCVLRKKTKDVPGKP